MLPMQLPIHLSAEQKLIAASAVSVLTLGVCLWAFWFVVSGVARDDAVRAEITDRLDGFAQDRARAQAFNALHGERRGDIARITGFFADRVRPIAFLHTLEDLGRATGTAVAIEVDDAGNDATHLGFRVIVEGNGQDRMVRYVRLLERLPYAITVTRISEEKKSLGAPTQLMPANRLVVALRVRTR